MYIFTNILGSFVLDVKFNIIDQGTEKKLRTKHKDLQEVPKKKLTKVLLQFKDPQYYQTFREENIKLTKHAMKESVSEDHLIIQTIANVSELDKVLNILTKRLREWYSLYFPELSENTSKHEAFVKLVMSKTRAQLLKELDKKETMGADLEKPHVTEMLKLAEQIQNLQDLRAQHEIYLEKVMKKYCPNLMELAGVTIGAKLIELGKGLKRLALFPASTIQLLGAEKALFRHIKTGSRSPKHGVIINHPLVQKSKRSNRGKMARQLADKLSLCARLDYFKGEFKAPEYKTQLEEKLEE